MGTIRTHHSNTHVVVEERETQQHITLLHMGADHYTVIYPARVNDPHELEALGELMLEAARQWRAEIEVKS